MKFLFICICCALFAGAHAETVITKSYPAERGQQVNLKFDYPVVKVSTWDKNEVSVVAHVDINGGESDSAFELDGQTTNGTLVISDRIKDMDKLPHRYTIVRNGVKTVYKSKEQFKDAEKQGNVTQSFEGLDMNITVEIKIPAYCTTNVDAVYGMVEMKDFNAPVIIDAKYGGIDATINASSVGKLKTTTHYGQIYSNLDLKITDHEQRDFFNSISAEPGNGPSYTLTSDYGKIYLRKP